jgi:uncharacterized membrane protein
MREAIIHVFEVFPVGWTTFIIAMLPIVELRGSIPYGIGMGMAWPQTYVLSVLGNLVPIVPILLFLGPVSDWLERVPGFGRFFQWLFRRTRRRSKLVERYGPWGLILFVAIPLPVTGAWTGSAAAYVFGIPFRRSFPAIAGGVLLAGVVVTLAVQGVIGLGSLFLGSHS